MHPPSGLKDEEQEENGSFSRDRRLMPQGNQDLW
jgi:hypothetical protein